MRLVVDGLASVFPHLLMTFFPVECKFHAKRDFYDFSKTSTSSGLRHSP